MSILANRGSMLGALLALLTVLAAAPASAQDESAWTWENATEFSFVTASGNSRSTTLGLKGELIGETDVDAFKLEIGGIRASSKFRERTAVGTPGSFTVTETTREEKSAENYYARTRYDRDLGEDNFFVFGGAGWERNTFAGFNDRLSFVLGFGDAWINDDRTLFKTDIGGTYTIQKDVEPTPGKDEGFGGLRVNVEFKRALNQTTNFATLVTADENLADTDDFRIDWISSVSFNLTEGLAFKTSYQLLYDNQPALVSVPLFITPGNPAGQNVTVPSQNVDNFLTLSLVITL
jgi:putative salt-induced outer membrane protein YdiY